MDVDPPVGLQIFSFQSGEDEMTATVLVETGDEALTGDIKLRCGILSNHVGTGFFAGSNGQSEFYNDVITFSPDASGVDCLIGANSSQVFTFTFEWPIILTAGANTLEIEGDNLTVFAFVQNDDGHEILNADWAPFGNATYAVSFDQTSFLTDPGAENTVNIDIANVVEDDLDLDFVIDNQLPDGWTFSYTTPDGDQSGDYTFSLGGDESVQSIMTVQMDEDMSDTDGYLSITYYSQQQPEIVSEQSFYFVMCDEILVINKIPEGDFAHYYADAFANIENYDEYDVADWNCSVAPLDYNAVTDVNPEIIIYAAGGLGGMDVEEMAYFEDFLNAGGDLWVTGSYIPDVLEDTDLLDMMGAEYVSDYPSADDFYGEDGDDYFAGITGTIRGGDGADNAMAPSSIRDTDGATCMRFSVVRRCAVRHTTDTYNTFILSFPFEAITDQDTRNAVMQAAMDHLTGVDAVRDVKNNTVPQTFVMEQNYPNPFNPSTEINFFLPEKADVTMTVFDITGREVTTLVSENLVNGWHNVSWNAHNLSSGIYFYRINAFGTSMEFSKTMKMMLMK